MGSCLPLGQPSYLGGSQAVNIAIPTLVFSIALLEANPVGVGEGGKGSIVGVVCLDLGNREPVIVDIDLVVHDVALTPVCGGVEDVDAFLF